MIISLFLTFSASPNYNVLLSRTYEPNAMSLGDGLFAIHINLFNIIDNESQLAFILAHEMAHDLLEHNEKSLVKKIKLETSEEIKKKASAIKKTKYNKTNLVLSEIKNILYNDGKLTRKDEVSADSLAYLLLKKTSYDPNESIRALKHLDLVDEEMDSMTKSDLKKYFNLPNQSFDPNWLNEEDFSSYSYHKENVYGIHEDSLKTHPEIDKRIDLLKRYFSELKSPKSDNKSLNNKFEDFKTRTRRETVQSLHHLEDIGLSLYEALKQVKKTPRGRMAVVYDWRKSNKINQSQKRTLLQQIC